MNRILRKITNECYNTDTQLFFKRIGNYKINRTKYCIHHYYYNHEIFKVDLMKQTFEINYCGYENSIMTKAQINFLTEFYYKKGYRHYKTNY